MPEFSIHQPVQDPLIETIHHPQPKKSADPNMSFLQAAARHTQMGSPKNFFKLSHTTAMTWRAHCCLHTQPICTPTPVGGTLEPARARNSISPTHTCTRLTPSRQNSQQENSHFLPQLLLSHKTVFNTHLPPTQVRNNHHTFISHPSSCPPSTFTAKPCLLTLLPLSLIPH